MKSQFSKFLHYIGRPQFVIPGMILAAFLCFLPKTEALRFNPDIEGYKIDIPYPQEEPYWKLSGYDTEYKNAILKDFQNMLSNAGIPRKEQRWYVSQLYQENGALDPVRLGDNGCSFGLIQYNACVHDGISATKFMQRHPEWKDHMFQLRVMTDWIVERRKIYKGNIKRVVVHHNSPAAAARGTDTKAGYYNSIAKKTNLLTSSL